MGLVKKRDWSQVATLNVRSDVLECSSTSPVPSVTAAFFPPPLQYFNCSVSREKAGFLKKRRPPPVDATQEKAARGVRTRSNRIKARQKPLEIARIGFAAG